jgi:hypothetical protein
MSLKDPDDEYEDLVPTKKDFLGKNFKKNKTHLTILLIGIILGLLIQLFFINPLINDLQTNSCKECIYSKELLNQENECLYTLITDKNASEQCAAQNFNEKNNTAQSPPLE